MKAKVIETGEIVDVVSIIDRQYGCLISFWDGKKGKEYSRFELDFRVGKQINDKISKPIDWEQRRYEIAKDILVASCNQLIDGVSITSHAHDCVRWVDALIEELKGRKE